MRIGSIVKSKTQSHWGLGISIKLHANRSNSMIVWCNGGETFWVMHEHLEVICE